MFIANIAVVLLVACLASAILHSVALLVGVSLHVLEASLFEAAQFLLRRRVVDSIVKLVIALSSFDEGLVSDLLFDLSRPLKAHGLGSSVLVALSLQWRPVAKVLWP